MATGVFLWFLPPENAPLLYIRSDVSGIHFMARKALRFHPTSGRMLIDTGCSVFDSQCSHLTSGNHWGNCQFSMFVRPASETECSGRTLPVGELFEFDVKAFTIMPPYVVAAIRAMNRTIVVSEIRHYIRTHGQERKIVHGDIVTDSAERLIRIFQTTDGRVSERILSTVLPYVADLGTAKQSV
jgi:hypothetical protein